LNKKLQRKVTTYEYDNTKDEIASTNKQINALIYHLYGLNKEESEVIDNYINANQKDN